MDSDADRTRSTSALVPEPIRPDAEPRPSEPAAETETPDGTTEPEEADRAESEDRRVREAVTGGMVLVFLIVGGLGAYWFWSDASSPNLIWTAIWEVFWPWGLLAALAGGFLSGMRCALRIRQESEDRPVETGEAFVLAAFAMWGVVRGFLKETKEDGQSLAKVLVVIAAIVLLLLVFAPSALDEIKRWLDSHL